MGILKDKTLYHGSLEIVTKPEIRIYPDRAMDFGQGFYCTTSFEQADKWAKAKIRKGNANIAYVNEYTFEKFPGGLRIKEFPKEPNLEWLDFVVESRTNPKHEYEYDIVTGPVANDDAFAAIETYIAEGDTSQERKEKLIKELKTYKLRDQILFHTEESIKRLSFVRQHKVLPDNTKSQNINKTKGKTL